MHAALDQGVAAVRWFTGPLSVDPGRIRRTQIEALGNALLLAPIGFLLAPSFDRLRLRTLLGWCVGGSCAIELLQGTLLLGRHPSARDVLLNSLGAAAGLAASRLLIRRDVPTIR